MKMTRRNFLKSSVVAGAALGSIGFPAVLRKAEAAPVVLKFATYEPPQSYTVVNVMKPWCDAVNQAAGDQLRIDFYPGGQLGPDVMQQLKMVVDGIADITVTALNWMPGRFPEATCMNAPMVAHKMLDASWATYNMWKEGMFGGFDDIYPLSMNAQPQYFYHTNFAARLPQDLKGRKINAVGRMMAAVLRNCGASPVGEGISKIAENISRGLLEGCAGEWFGMENFRMIDVTSNHIMVPLGTNVFPIIMNKRKLDRLPAGARDILLAHSDWTLTEKFARAWDGNNDNIEARVRADAKHTVVDPTPEEDAAWAKVVEPVVGEWLKESPAKNQKLLDVYSEMAAEGRRKFGIA